MVCVVNGVYLGIACGIRRCLVPFRKWLPLVCVACDIECVVYPALYVSIKQAKWTPVDSALCQCCVPPLPAGVFPGETGKVVWHCVCVWVCTGGRECRERQDSVACSQSHSLPLHACSAKWLLAHLWASEKQKHRRKGSAKEEEEEAHKKQLQAVVESFQRSALLGVCG